MCIFMWTTLICFHFYFLPFLSEDNCFTILYWFLPYVDMNQPQMYIRPLPPEPRSHLSPFYRSRLSQSTRLSSLCHRANSHLLSSLHMVIYMFPCCFLNLSNIFFPRYVHKSIHFVWVSTVVLQIRFISAIFLDSICMH